MTFDTHVMCDFRQVALNQYKPYVLWPECFELVSYQAYSIYCIPVRKSHYL